MFFFNLFLTCVSEAVFTSAATTPAPVLPSTKPRLAKLATRLREDPSFRAIWGDDEYRLYLSQMALGDLENPALWKDLERNQNFAFRVWWTCNALSEQRTELDRSSCSKLEEGEEMMACSRCLAVRYCSREHQRADWKRHKKFCFKPTW
ncbi:hypothetical protein BDY24DRAFT_95370 [Mrakia frigida]|uniref:zinc finger MYND domain-containing protein n=1 Tax=Mrakia frigida TaxID=29902 RepID=UPI003FCBF0F7